MTGTRIVALGLRFVAIWFVVVGVQSVNVVFAFQEQDHRGSSRWWIVVPLAIFLVAAAILWRFATPLARKLYGPDQPAEKFAIDTESALRVGCCLLGLSILPRVVFPMITVVDTLYDELRPGVDVTGIFYFNQALQVAFYLALAWAFTFKSRAIARFLLAQS